MRTRSRITPARTLAAALGLAFLRSVHAAAQEPPFYYPTPRDGAVTTRSNVEYARFDTTTLKMDVYRPTAPERPRNPALIFFDVVSGPERVNGFTRSWARAAAAHGVVGIVPDLVGREAERDFTALVSHLRAHADDYGIDPDAIAVYAASGNAYTALPIIEDPKQTGIKAAVIYYGIGPVKQFRLDLPLLYVRAGLDRPGMTTAPDNGIVQAAARAMLQNAPITIINDASAHHAFEYSDDDAATRDAIDRTIDFVKRATAPDYQAAIRRGLTEAAAAADVLAGDFHAAAERYASLVAARPDDSRLRLSYGEALVGDGQFAAACSTFESLKGKGLGPRDLGIPAATACMQKGDAEAAMAWLRTIPSRFLPPDLQASPVFARLAERADFKALFSRAP